MKYLHKHKCSLTIFSPQCAAIFKLFGRTATKKWQKFCGVIIARLRVMEYIQFSNTVKTKETGSWFECPEYLIRQEQNDIKIIPSLYLSWLTIGRWLGMICQPSHVSVISAKALRRSTDLSTSKQNRYFGTFEFYRHKTKMVLTSWIWNSHEFEMIFTLKLFSSIMSLSERWGDSSEKHHEGWRYDKEAPTSN